MSGDQSNKGGNRPLLTNKIEEFELEPDVDPKCGFGSCTPAPLQYLHNAKVLVFCLSLLGMTLGMAVNGLVSISITTLEKRFDLSSTETGLFAGSYKLASMCTMLPIAYLAAKGHKGRYLGMGAVSLGTGSFVLTLTQFLSDNYEYGHKTSFNDTSLATSVCLNDSVSNQNSEAIEPVSRLYFHLLIVGQLLHGCAGAPIILLAVTFIDENVSQMASPVYSSIFMACRNVIGPALGYIFGGMSLKIYGDFLTVDRDQVRLSGPEDMRWYGAWWLGFLVTSIMALSLSFPIFMFGRQLPEARRHRSKDVNMAYKAETEEKRDDDRQEKKPLSTFSNGVLSAVGRLVRNPTFTACVLTQTTEAFILAGLVTFSPKYFENVFGLSSSSASLISGCVLLSGGLCGTLLGGYLIRRFRLKAPGVIRLAIVSGLICVPTYLLFLIKCDQLPFAGQSVHYEAQTLVNNFNQSLPGLHADCNAPCHCSGYFEPACNPVTRTTYYSPCFAGCLSSNAETGMYSSCSCLSSPSEYVMAGGCKADCDLFTVFCVCYAVYALIMFTSNIPIQQTVLRCVEFEQRTLAMGTMLFMDGVGNLVGALVFGAMFDSLCVQWKVGDVEQAVLSKKSCVRYDADRMGPTIIAAGATSKLIGILLLFVAYKFYKAPLDNDVRDDHVTDTAVEKQQQRRT